MSSDPLEQAIRKAIAEGLDGGEGAEPIRPLDPDDMSAGEEESLEDEAEEDHAGYHQCGDSSHRHKGRAAAQTGPKGVLADYRENQHRAHAEKQIQNERLLQKITKHSMALTLKPTKGTGNDDDNDEELDRLLLEDELMMAQFRHQRIQELTDRRQIARGGDRPKFGTYRQITANDYVRELEQEEPNVTIVMHLYQNFVPECRQVHACLEELSQRYGYAKFLRIVSTDADARFDEIALPAVLVYRGGELMATLLRVHEEVRDVMGSSLMTSAATAYGGMVGSTNFHWDDLERLLLRRGALLEEDYCEMSSLERQPFSTQRLREVEDDSD